MKKCKKLTIKGAKTYSCSRAAGHTGKCKPTNPVPLHPVVQTAKPKLNNAAQDFSDKLNTYLAIQKTFLEARQELEMAWERMTNEQAPLSDFLDSLVNSFC